MMRGTFANIRLRNQLAPGTEGGWTTYQPGGDVMTIYDAAMKYKEAGVPLVIRGRQGVRIGIVARLGGQGHAAAWRARGDLPRASSAFTAAISSTWACCRCSSRLARPQPRSGSPASELFEIAGVASGLAPGGLVTVKAVGEKTIEFQAIARIDTPEELVAFRHGGILPYVLRQIVTRR